MNKYKVYAKMRYLVLLTVAIVAGCASNAQEIPSIPDTIAPTVSVTSPANGDVAVFVNRKVSVAFSEVMASASVSTASFSVKETVSGINVPGAVTPVGTSATFAPSAALKFSTGYTATIKGGVSGVKDLAGNTMVSDFVFTFTTGLAADIIAPTVSVTSPTDTAVAVPTSRKVTVGFSEEMDPATISDALASFTLKETLNNAPVGGTVSRAGTSAIFTPTPTIPLKTNTKYTATIKGGIGGVKDLANIPMAIDFVFTFTTGPTADVTAPTLISTFPANVATGLPVNTVTTATFSEPMNPATLASPATNFTVKETLNANAPPVNGVVTYSGNTATFTPSINALKPNTQYTSTITTGATGAKDLSDVALINGPTVNPWKWTTGDVLDITAPRVTVTNPAKLAIDVPVDKKINVTFNEAMSLDTMTTANFKLNETGIIGDITGTVAYDVQNNIATFTPQLNLKPDTNYTVNVTNGAKDSAGNPLVVPAVDGLNPWTFQTAAVIIPPVVPGDLLSTFGIASFGGISNIGATKINGDVVLAPTATCNLEQILSADGPGFGLCGGNIINIPTNNVGDIVVTPLYPDTTTAIAVRVALTAKWNTFSPAGRPGATVLGCGTIGTSGGGGAGIGCPGSDVLPPGTYISSTSSTIDVSGDLTLNGNATDVWVFQAPSALITAVNSRIILTGGAKASNVWWFVGSDATLNGGSTFQGNILASRSISMGTAATSCGRLLAGAEGAGAFTFLENTVSVPGHINAPGCL